MALPKYTEPHYRIWHYIYLTICAAVFFFLIAPLFVIFPLSFNAEEFLSFSDGMKSLDPDAFSLRWYKDMIYGTKKSLGISCKEQFYNRDFRYHRFSDTGNSRGCRCKQ